MSFIIDKEQILKEAKRMYEAELYDSVLVTTSLLLSSLKSSRGTLFQELKWEANLLFGNTLLATREYARATSYFEKAVNLQSKEKEKTSIEYEIRFQCGKCWMLANNDKEAEKWLSSIPELERSGKVWKMLAHLYERFGDDRSAIYCYRVLLDQNPLSVEAVTRLAELGATKKQIEALKKDDRPSWMSDYIESVFCQQQFNFKGELKHLKTMEKKFHFNQFVQSRIGQCYSSLGQPIDAFNAFTKLQSSESNLIRDMDIYAHILSDAGRSQDLQRLSHRASDYAPFRPETWTIMAWDAHNRDETEQALTFLEKALELDPTHYSTLMAKGRFLLESGRISEAVLILHKLVAMTNSIRANEGLVNCYLALDQPKEAFTVASTLFKRAPVPRTMTLLALTVNHLQGREEESISLFKSVLSVAPHCMEAAYGLANILTKNQKLDEAIKLANPESTAAKDMLTRLEKIVNGAEDDEEDYDGEDDDEEQDLDDDSVIGERMDQDSPE